MYKLVYIALIQFYLHKCYIAQENSTGVIDVEWHFNADLEGWANSMAEEMQAEVSYSSTSGEIRGNVNGQWPHIDSPHIRSRVIEPTHVVLRMLYQGSRANTGQIQLLVSDTTVSDPLAAFATTPHRITFDLISDDTYHLYYIPIGSVVRGIITNVRVFPAVPASDGATPSTGDTFAIDWIMIANAPMINRVTGCSVNQYYDRDGEFTNPVASVEEVTTVLTNSYLPTVRTTFMDSTLPFASTYNCLRSGGERIRIDGTDFGSTDAIILVDDNPCVNVVHNSASLECTLPPSSLNSLQHSKVTVKNGRFNGLSCDSYSLEYAVPVPALVSAPVITNIATHAFDVAWNAPSNFWEALTVTGYVLTYKDSSSNNDEGITRTIVLGNVTKTTVITGVQPGRTYDVTVAPVVEDQATSDEWEQIDLYGRREMISGALISDPSPTAVTPKTLSTDFVFSHFDANSTLNHTEGHDDSLSSVGPTGEVGSQGHYGLYVVGNANVEGCNASFVCCDNFNEGGCGTTCDAIGSETATYVDGESNRGLRTNAPPPTSGDRKTFDQIVFSTAESAAHTATLPCGPALRLTASHSLQAGSAWYARKMNVREGFDTTFSFRISSPSTKCTQMDDVYTHCRARGGDGLALVIQNHESAALGLNGMELGYGGIPNSVAVEFDTRYNYEQLDPYENHLSVHTRGFREDNSGNHSYSLGSSVNIPDLTDGVHNVRVTYDPIFRDDSVFSGAFDATPHVSTFLTNADFPNGGQADWSTGMGMLSIYLDDLLTPKLIVPLNIDSTLSLDHGRAYVGFTASTGEKSWQTHDVLSWAFTSKRTEAPYFPPPIINNEGSHGCRDNDVCVHK